MNEDQEIRYKLEEENKDLFRMLKNQEKLILEQANQLDNARDSLFEEKLRHDVAMNKIAHDLEV